MACFFLCVLMVSSCFINFAMCRPLSSSFTTNDMQMMTLKPDFFAYAPLKSISLTTMESNFAKSPSVSAHSRHKPFDKAFAGGKIIVCGLALSIFVAVFCYIRITRQRSLEVKSQTYFLVFIIFFSFSLLFSFLIQRLGSCYLGNVMRCSVVKRC